MPETNQAVSSYQVAKDVTDEAIKALSAVYWANSFNADLLQNRLLETIAFFTRNALELEGLRHTPKLLEREEANAIAVPETDQPFVDLRDRPSPEILRVIAIGSPQVVNFFVITQFQLGYARPEEWSRQLPTVNPGEVMRILTKRISLTQ